VTDKKIDTWGIVQLYAEPTRKGSWIESHQPRLYTALPKARLILISQLRAFKEVRFGQQVYGGGTERAECHILRIVISRSSSPNRRPSRT
jgi:hypothetical protein